MQVLLRTTFEIPADACPGNPIDLHSRLPGYEVTPLVVAPHVAQRLGVARVFVKNETRRFGLPSFKVLGASWATYLLLQNSLGPAPDGPLTIDGLKSWAFPARRLTLLAATDGNHGRAVARVARWFGLKARIYVPDFVSLSRRRAIQAEKADVYVVQGNYDLAVDTALEESNKPDCLLISDTARADSDLVSQLVSAGYITAFLEAEQQLSQFGEDRINVVGVQAGVGGLACAATRWASKADQASQPKIVVTEPERAACVLAALAAGEPKTISASEPTAMAVLRCGTVSLTAYPVLQAGVSACIAVDDPWAVEATSTLRLAGVESGPSGAAGLAGFLAAASDNDSFEKLRRHLSLSSESRLLFIATEGTSSTDSLNP